MCHRPKAWRRNNFHSLSRPNKARTNQLKEAEMKTYDVTGSEIQSGIEVASLPYPHLTLGEGGNKRATWIALGKRDIEQIIVNRMIPCSMQGEYDSSALPNTCSTEHICEKCGKKYGQWEKPDPFYGLYFRYHPKDGEVIGSRVVEDVGGVALKGENGVPNGRYLIVAPQKGDNRVLVLWRVSSGYRGSASISAGEDVTVIALDSSWHSGRGNLGETAEILVILKPGQELHASRSGRRVQETEAKLVYDGKKITVTFGGDEMNAATADKVEGDYL